MKKRSIKSIILKIFCCIFILIAVFMEATVSTVKSLDKVHSPEEVKVGNGEKQVLLIYEPSKTGSNKNVALKTADVMVHNGCTVTINYPSQQLNYDLNKYDVILFGSPVYAGKVSPVLEDYIMNNKIENKKVIVYNVGKFADNKKELEELKSCVPAGNTISAEKYTDKTEKVFLDFIKKSM